MKTEILATHNKALFAAAVTRAAALLRAGEVVALPTETVYGLAANALDETAVAKIFQVKGRPAHNPVIVHVAGDDMARACAAQWPETASALARAFWPGPLTLVLPRAKTIPDNVTAGGATVGIRWPGHPFMQAVIRECGFPLAAPSANLSNQVSPTNARHVRAQLEGKISLIVDGGQSQVGIESTVLDLTASPPRILRPGMIHAGAIAAVCGAVQDEKAKTPAGEQVLRSPGLLKKHYSPKAKLVVLEWPDEAALLAQLAAYHLPSAVVHIIAHTKIPAGFAPENVSVIPHDAEAFARALYGELHRCDAAGAGLIVVEAPPESPAWSAIADRLRRAAA
ncbi:MAG TPA: L-threonylcarbamoyladenylate synthase [Candidatus Acidoferrales bacterium]|jgi:L-threonylcarbamoyladenylate synthase|nr:L-threonylcarbamoyladenylate synthase [Candidatus Acidoferrales bacterium]